MTTSLHRYRKETVSDRGILSDFLLSFYRYIHLCNFVYGSEGHKEERAGAFPMVPGVFVTRSCSVCVTFLKSVTDV